MLWNHDCLIFRFDGTLNFVFLFYLPSLLTTLSCFQLLAGERLPLPSLLPPPLRNLMQGLWSDAPYRPTAAAAGAFEFQLHLRNHSHAAAAHQLRLMGARRPTYPERFSRCEHAGVGFVVVLLADLLNDTPCSCEIQAM